MNYPKLKSAISKTNETILSLRKQLEVVAKDLQEASIGGQVKFWVIQRGQYLGIQAVNPYAEDPAYHTPITILNIRNDKDLVYDMDSCLLSASEILSQFIDPNLLKD